MLLKTDDSHCLFFGFCFSFTYLIPFKVILEDLPDEFATALREYNRQVTDVFSQYLTTVAADLEKERGEENKLPLSGIGKIRSLIILYVTFFLPMSSYYELLVILAASKIFKWIHHQFLRIARLRFPWKQLFVFHGFDKNYTWHVLSAFVCLFLFFLQATLTSQLCATAKRKAWCYFGNSISRSKRIILGKFLTLG